jgi:hypothetical protein
MRRALLYVSATFAHATLLLGVVAAMRGCEAGMASGADRVGRAGTGVLCPVRRPVEVSIPRIGKVGGLAK